MQRILIIFFVLVLPWQTRWIFGETMINGTPSEYGRLFISVVDVVGMMIALVWLYGMKVAVTRHRFLKNPLRFLFLLPAFALISSIWASEPALAVQVGIRLLIAVIVALGIQDETKHFHRIAILAFLVGLLPSAILGIWQIIVQHVDASTLLGIAEQVPSRLGAAVVELNGERVLRAYGTFSHPNVFGGVMALGALLALFASSFSNRVWQRRIACFTAVTLTIGLAASVSRAALLAFVIGCLVWLFFSSRDLNVRRRGLGAFRCILVGALIGVALFGNLWLARTDALGRLEQKSVNDRVAEWSLVKDIISTQARSRLIGAGAGNMVFESAKVTPGLPVYGYQPTHNVFVLFFLEFGLAGCLLILFVIGKIRPTGRIELMRAALIAPLFMLALFDHWLWTTPFGLYFIAVMLGCFIRNKHSS